MQMCVLAMQFVPKRECQYFSVLHLDTVDADCKLLLGMRNLFKRSTSARRHYSLTLSFPVSKDFVCPLPPVLPKYC